ncbi:MAG: sugar transferase [Bacteroidia bacterium]|nr:sugar transferase [Bacteroidia bacterium]MBP9689355.1 sugar transferase [Bacteroidia bacterium]
MFKRIFDIVCSLLGILVLSPVFVVLWVAIKLESKGSAFFLQTRVGKNNIDFKLYKFRSMYLDAESRGQLTVGMRDPRITKVGYYLRKFKLDELPQLINVIKGDMSLVGPRPEVRKYVQLYSPQQLKVLTIRPGITDYASIQFINENELLANAENPEEYYINNIMPEKLELNLQYINNSYPLKDLGLILKTLIKIIS